MEQYLNLAKEILAFGVAKEPARNGMPPTLSLFGPQISFDLQKGFPILTTKRIFWKGVVTELLWFLNGGTNVKYLNENGVTFWNDDAFNYYDLLCDRYSIPIEKRLDFDEFVIAINENDIATEFEGTEHDTYNYGDCGYQYGKVWRNWDVITIDPVFEMPARMHVDQIARVINTLMAQPYGRRHIVTAVDPLHDKDLALYWCHSLFQFNCRPLTTDERIKQARQIGIQDYQQFNNEEDILISLDKSGIPKFYLDCKLYQRSGDMFLGVPFNISSYALLIHIIARICNMIPGKFIHTFGDVHLYGNHMEAIYTQLKRTPKQLPFLTMNDIPFQNLDAGEDFDNFLAKLEPSDFTLAGYTPDPEIKAPLSTGRRR